MLSKTMDIRDTTIQVMGWVCYHVAMGMPISPNYYAQELKIL